MSHNGRATFVGHPKMYSPILRRRTTQPGMEIARKDHACLMVEIDGDKGILVKTNLISTHFSHIRDAHFIGDRRSGR